MSLPANWVDRIFLKLSMVYGQDFMRRYEGLQVEAVKADWAHELRSFAQKPESIGWALEHLPAGGIAPTVIDFRNICARRPDPAAQAQLSKKADPEVVRMCIERLRQGGIDMPHQGGPDIRWAHKIVDRCKRGERVSAAALQMARNVIEHRSRVA